MSSKQSDQNRNPWPAIFPRLLEKRARKPRTQGLTMVLDRCLGPSGLEDFCDLAGDYCDLLKFGFGTVILYESNTLKRKIEVARSRQIDVLPGGTLIEIAVAQNCLKETLKLLKNQGFSMVEISDGSIPMSESVRRDCFNMAFDFGLQVISEVGKKDPTLAMSTGEMADSIERDLSWGARFVVIEARESGKGIGIYDHEGTVKTSFLDELCEKVKAENIDRLIWEAPQKDQQVALIQKFGTNVSLGNVSPQDLLGLEALRNGLRWDTMEAVIAGLE